MAADPFELALAEIEGGEADPFEAALAEAAPAAEAPGMGESLYRGAVQGASLRFGDEVQAAIGAGYYGVAKGVRSLLPGGVPEDAPDVGEVYTQLRDQFRAENAAAEEANPGTYATGEVGGAIAGSGVNPIGAAKAVGSGFRALLTREGLSGVAAAGRGLLTREGARAAAVEGGKASAIGAVYGGATAVGGSESLETVASDLAEGALFGAGVGLGARGLLGTLSAAQGARAAGAADRAGAAKASKAFDEEVAALPEKQAAAQVEAQEALTAKTLSNPLVRTGLEGKQSTLRGPKRARARAQALVDEPLPGDPSKKLVDEADKLAPDERLEFATALRRSQGEALGKIRDELAKTEIPIAVEPIRAELRGAFGELPSEVQGRALEQVDALIGKVAEGGTLTPDALRKLITDSESFSKFSTPSLEAALGNARGRVFQTARQVLVNYEQAALAKARPDLVPEYVEGLRKYGVYSDFELGSDVMFRKANKGQPTVKIPKAPKVQVPEPVATPQVEQGRALLQPSAAAKGGADAIRAALPAAAGTAGYAAGGYLAGAAATFAGAKLSEPAAQLWLRLMTPTAEKLAGKAAKLERLRPMMEEALAKGPAEVARIHAIFMDRSPDYRKAIESE